MGATGKDSAGRDTFTRGPESEYYGNNNWGWALNHDRSLQEKYDTTVQAQRYAIERSIIDRNFEPKIDGFRFDQKNAATEWAVISSLVEEYRASFEYGAFGADTQAKFNEFKAKLNAAGLEKLSAEFKRQYADFLRTN
jgi:hypothetical protein